MNYAPPVLNYRCTINGYGLYVKKVGCARYIYVTRASDHKHVADFDAPYVGRLRDLYEVFKWYGAKRLPCPERDDEFTPERIADAREWRLLLVKNTRGDYELFSHSRA